MRKITITEVGYFHPSQANWNYNIFLIVDKTGARFYKATFGGEHRIKQAVRELDQSTSLNGIQLEYLHAGIGSDTQFKGRAVAKMPDIEWYNGFNWGEKAYQPSK